MNHTHETTNKELSTSSEGNFQLGRIDAKLDTLLNRDWTLELMKVIVPVLTAAVGAAAAFGGAYLAYHSKQEEIADERLYKVIEIANTTTLSSENAKLILDVAQSMGVSPTDTPILAFLQAVVSGDRPEVERIAQQVVEENPAGAERFVETASRLGAESAESIQVGIANSNISEEAKKSLLDKAKFNQLLTDIEESPDRFDAMVELRENWQHEPGFVEALIQACQGKVQVESKYGINVRLINTMDILRRCDESILLSNEPFIRAWLEGEVLGRVGPNTTTMAKSLQNRLDRIAAENET